MGHPYPLLASLGSDLPNSLPILWRQSPLGSSLIDAWRYHQPLPRRSCPLHDENANRYGAIDSFGIVFSGGASSQISITTDCGEFATLLNAYLSSGGSEVFSLVEFSRVRTTTVTPPGRVIAVLENA